MQVGGPVVAPLPLPLEAWAAVSTRHCHLLLAEAISPLTQPLASYLQWMPKMVSQMEMMTMLPSGGSCSRYWLGINLVDSFAGFLEEMLEK